MELVVLVLWTALTLLTYRGIRHRTHPWASLGIIVTSIVVICELCGPFGVAHIEIAGWKAGLSIASALAIGVLLLWAGNGAKW